MFFRVFERETFTRISRKDVSFYFCKHFSLSMPWSIVISSYFYVYINRYFLETIMVSKCNTDATSLIINKVTFILHGLPMDTLSIAPTNIVTNIQILLWGWWIIHHPIKPPFWRICKMVILSALTSHRWDKHHFSDGHFVHQKFCTFRILPKGYAFC